MLRFEPVAVPATTRMRAMARSSSPAPMRCAASSRTLQAAGLLKLPLFAVGEHTAAAARRAGFAKVIAANGDAAALRDLVLASVKAKAAEESQPRCFIWPAPIWRAISPANSASAALRVVTHTTYRMIPVSEPAARGLRRFRGQPDRGGAALFAAQRARVPGGGARRRRRNIGAGDPAMLHFRRGGLDRPRRRGHPGHWWRASPDENALFEALDRALRA